MPVGGTGRTGLRASDVSAPFLAELAATQAGLRPVQRRSVLRFATVSGIGGLFPAPAKSFAQNNFCPIRMPDAATVRIQHQLSPALVPNCNNDGLGRTRFPE